MTEGAGSQFEVRGEGCGGGVGGIVDGVAFRADSVQYQFVE